VIVIVILLQGTSIEILLVECRETMITTHSAGCQETVTKIPLEETFGPMRVSRLLVVTGNLCCLTQLLTVGIHLAGIEIEILGVIGIRTETDPGRTKVSL
jgi:hypothetical protein